MFREINGWRTRVMDFGSGERVLVTHGARSPYAMTLNKVNLEIRGGLHTGECALPPDGDNGGLAVHIGRKSRTSPGRVEVLVSSTGRDLIGARTKPQQLPASTTSGGGLIGANSHPIRRGYLKVRILTPTPLKTGDATSVGSQ
jgi:hypothetical protein